MIEGDDRSGRTLKLQANPKAQPGYVTGRLKLRGRCDGAEVVSGIDVPVRMRIEPPIQLSPFQITFDPVKLGSVAEREAIVSTVSDARIRDLTVTCDSPMIAAELKPQPDGHQMLIITLRATQLGMLSAVLTVHGQTHDGKTVTVTVPVRGVVVP